MMNDITDAPYIRDAELYGMDDGPEIEWKCPVCGADCPDDLYIQNGEVIGCSECIRCKDGAEWAADHMEEDEHE